MISMLTALGWHLMRLKNCNLSARFTSIAGFSAVIVIALIEGTLFHPLPILIGLALIAPALAGVGQGNENSIVVRTNVAREDVIDLRSINQIGSQV